MAEEYTVYTGVPQVDSQRLLSKEEYYYEIPKSRRSSSKIYTTIVLSLSLIANVVILVLWRGSTSTLSPVFEPEAPSTWAQQIELPTIYKPFHWNTIYSSTNRTLQDKLWDQILPSHGFVAIDRTEAAGLGYPESMYLPRDQTKGVYLLEAYHQLHCLRILHTTMRESLDKVDFTWKPGSHIEHCFDYLIQTAMCNADTTPLYTFGDNTAGDQQVHKCKDWNALRDYATANRACYRDSIADIPLGQHFGYCDDGDDGLLEPSESRIERLVESN